MQLLKFLPPEMEKPALLSVLSCSLEKNYTKKTAVL